MITKKLAKGRTAGKARQGTIRRARAGRVASGRGPGVAPLASIQRRAGKKAKASGRSAATAVKAAGRATLAARGRTAAAPIAHDDVVHAGLAHDLDPVMSAELPATADGAGDELGVLEVEGLAVAEDLGEHEVAAEAPAATGDAEVADDVETAHEEVADDDADETVAAAKAAAVAAAKAGDDPVTPLSKYFRDMSALSVLKPEQEFETARHIEALEIDLWRHILGFAPGAEWMLATIEPKFEKPVAAVVAYRKAAARTRGRASVPTRAAFEKVTRTLAEELREVDIDRIYQEAAVTEVRRVGLALDGLPVESAAHLPVKSPGFRDFVTQVSRRSAAVKNAKNEFVKANLRLVVSIARRFNHGRMPLADLIQEGNIGLMKAVERYDYRRGFRFSTYASWWIRHAISRALADKGRAVRLPVHMIDAYHRIGKAQRELGSKLERPPTLEELSVATGIELDKLEKMQTFITEAPVSLDKPMSDEDGRRLIDVIADPEEGPSVPDQMEEDETQTAMLRLLKTLKPIEADIIRKRFGLETDRELTLKEIGDEYQLSRERVRQLQEQALGKMRKAMARDSA